MASVSTLFYWDELVSGTRIQLGDYFLSRAEIIDFAGKYDPLPFHLDEEAARQSPIGVLCASGIHTMAILQRLTVESWFSRMHIVVGMGVDKLKFILPVLPDETLTGHVEVLRQMRLPNQDDRGAVIYRAEAYNPRGEMVASMQGTILVLRNPN